MHGSNVYSSPNSMPDGGPQRSTRWERWESELDAPTAYWWFLQGKLWDDWYGDWEEIPSWANQANWGNTVPRANTQSWGTQYGGAAPTWGVAPTWCASPPRGAAVQTWGTPTPTRGTAWESEWGTSRHIPRGKNSWQEHSFQEDPADAQFTDSPRVLAERIRMHSPPTPT